MMEAFPTSGKGEERDKSRLTGPMMVACQWNCSNPPSQYSYSNVRSNCLGYGLVRIQTPFFTYRGMLEGYIPDHLR
jgi:hypothetical protein